MAAPHCHRLSKRSRFEVEGDEKKSGKKGMMARQPQEVFGKVSFFVFYLKHPLEEEDSVQGEFGKMWKNRIFLQDT